MGSIRTLALIGMLAGVAAAEQDPPPVFRSDVRLVRLLATVKDFNGQLVGSLNKEDFTILDNGVKQEIAVFERTTAQPLSIALLMDTSASIAKDLKIATDCAKRFAASLFRDGNPEDTISLFTFNHDISQHTGFVRDSNVIANRIRPLKAEAGTSLYDAIFLAARALEPQDGRRVIVLVTDGGDTTSRVRYHDALEQAHRADAPIYSILLMPITNDAGRNIGGENALTTLGESTGGRLFTPTPGPELEAAFTEILRDLRTQYLIGFYPRNIPKTSSKYHTLRVELSRRDLRAATRTGYYGDSDPGTEPK